MTTKEALVKARGSARPQRSIVCRLRALSAPAAPLSGRCVLGARLLWPF